MGRTADHRVLLVVLVVAASCGLFSCSQYPTGAQPASESSGGQVTYTFVNDSWNDQALYIDSVLVDTIPFQDSVWYWGTVSVAQKRIVYLQSIVLSENYVWWADTFYANTDFRSNYYAGTKWFLLYVTNNTDRTMTGAVVETPAGYDSVDVYLPVGQDGDVGYFVASDSTDVRLYFQDTDLHVYWEDQNTLSSDTAAAVLSLEPDATFSTAKRRTASFSKPMSHRPPQTPHHLSVVLGE